MNIRKTAAALSAVTVLLAGTLLAAPASAADVATQSDIIVDLSNDAATSDLTYSATGFLYGLADDGVPTDTMLDGLTHLDTTVGRPSQGRLHPNGDALATADQWKRNGGGLIQIYMKDHYTTFPYGAYEDNDIEKEWLPEVRRQVNEIKNSDLAYKDDFVFVPFNEPDANDYNYGLLYSITHDMDKKITDTTGQKQFDALIKDWDIVYKTIKQEWPEAKVAGPNISYYWPGRYQQFIEHAVANGTVPDYVTWHELNGVAKTRGENNQSYYKNLEHWNTVTKAAFEKAGQTPRTVPVIINEYGLHTELTNPGTMIQYISRFENTDVSADLPYWHPSGDLDWLTTHNNQATASWWLYNWYGLLSGRQLGITYGNGEEQPTQAVASYDENKRQTRVVFGGAASGTTSVNAKLAFDGAADKYASGAHVTIYGVDATAAGRDPGMPPAASDGAYVLDQQDLTAQQLAEGISLTGLKTQSAYYAILTPSVVTATKAEQTQSERYEAEYARTSGKTAVAYGDAAGFSGAGYATGFDAAGGTGNGDAFFVTSKQDGYADIQIRYSAAKGEGLKTNRSLRLSINGGTPIDVMLPETEDAGTWNTAVVRAYLPLGINKIELLGGESGVSAGVNVDYIQLAASDAAADTYEAESTDNALAGTARVNGKAVTFVGNGDGNTLQFNKINVPEDGDYTITFTYAQNQVDGGNGFQTENRWADVTVNGDTAQTQRAVFANTRGWGNYWTTSIRVTLTKGDNTILIGNASGYAPNLDKITVGRTSVQTSPDPLPEPNPDGPDAGEGGQGGEGNQGGGTAPDNNDAGVNENGADNAEGAHDQKAAALSRTGASVIAYAFAAVLLMISGCVVLALRRSSR